MDRLEFAIRLEEEGEAFYTKQAAAHQGMPMGPVFLFLADAEKRHAELLRDRMSGMVTSELEDEDPSQLFERFRELLVEPGLQPGPVDVYRTATVIEEKSIQLYEEMFKDAKRPDDIKLLHFLIKQEQAHLQLFETLETLVKRPQEWVEAAEFGPREEY